MYYRFKDLQQGSYLLEGYNAQGLDQIKEAFIKLNKDLGNEAEFIRSIPEHVLTGYLKYGYEIQLESSLLPFPEQDEE